MNKQMFVNYLKAVVSNLPPTPHFDGDRQILSVLLGAIENGDFDA